MQVLRYPREHGAPPHTPADRRRDGGRRFARPFRSRAHGDRHQADEGPGRHELHGDDPEAQARDAQIDLLATLPHTTGGRLDREETPRREPFQPRPRRGIGCAFSRPAGFDSQIVYERDGAPGLTIEETGMRRTMQRVLSGIGAWVLVSSAPAFGADSAAGKSLFRQQCSVCHAAEPGDSGGAQGPSLIGVYGRHAGAAGFSYTAAMRAADLTWDTPTLNRFLASPTAVVPRSAML